MPSSLQRPRFANSLKESLTLPEMTAEATAAFRQDRAQVRQPLVMPTMMVVIAMMCSFTFWDIAREGSFGASARTRLLGAAAVAALTLLLRRASTISLRAQLLILYVAIYVWQLAIGTTLGTDAPLQFAGLLIIMFGGTMAFLHASDARINVLLALLSVTSVLPEAPRLADWIYVIGLFGAAVWLVYMLGAQMERSYAIAFLFHARLQREARTDPLTGLHNRRGLDAALRRELSRCDRTGAALSVAVIDIDHFKSVNDIHGHDVGDEVLSGTADLLVHNLRPTDVLVRLGGEEFGLLMVDTPLPAAKTLAERLRAAIEQHVFLPDSAAVRRTISVGITARVVGDEGWDALYHRADRALYEAKSGGRNQVRVS